MRIRPVRSLLLSVVILNSGLFHARAADAAGDSGLTVAVFDFTAKDKALEESGMLLADLARVQLGMRESVRMVTREDMEKILAEHKLQIAGLTEEAAPRAGSLLGAQVIVLGRLFSLNGQLYVTAKVIGVETGRVYGEMVQGDAAQLDTLGMTLGDKIAGLIEKGGETLVAKVKLTSEELRELKEKLGADNLPRVFVHVREETIGAQAPDPAAQTEIEHILLKAGFEVVKDRNGALKEWAENFAAGGGKSAPPSGPAVDLVLIGEAFGEYATRTGDLISARARIELEALDTRTGKTLAADRETKSAVDLAELIAAKTALQEGAARLTFRILPDAVKSWRTAHPKQEATEGTP